jgi:hypothetical protein
MGLRAAARRFKVHLRTVQRWIARAAGQRVSRADLSSRRRGPRHAPRRTGAQLEDRILQLRNQLKRHSALGEYGAAAILRALLEDKQTDVPSLRTIGRILARRGALDGNHRIRRPAPPRGWYLPDLAAGRAELDSFDIVEGLVIRGGTSVEVLNGVSLHGGLCASWPQGTITAEIAADRLVEHWRDVGLATYAQFDNDTVFQGGHRWPDSFGRVTRLCLSLGVTPVFTPPRETGFQAAVESYNGRWQAKVWSRFEHASMDELARRSGAFVAAARQRSAVRIEAAPARRAFPGRWAANPQAPLKGTVIFLRRSDASGAVHLLGRSFAVSAQWPHRLVRAQVDLTAGRIRFHALRRRQPDHQPLLLEVEYEVPKTRCVE